MKGFKGFQKGNKEWGKRKAIGGIGTRFKKGHTTNIGRIYSKDRNKKISKALTGRKASAETIERLREVQRQLWKNPEYHKHMVEVHKNQKVDITHLKEYWKTHEKTEEHKRKSKENHPRGENHPFWNPSTQHYGITKAEKKRRHDKIKQKADYRCQWPNCEKCHNEQRFGNRLNVHHKNGNKKDYRPDNLIVLCTPRHTSQQWKLKNKS